MQSCYPITLDNIVLSHILLSGKMISDNISDKFCHPFFLSSKPHRINADKIKNEYNKKKSFIISLYIISL
jgi:hypothetical protein